MGNLEARGERAPARGSWTRLSALAAIALLASCSDNKATPDTGSDLALDVSSADRVKSDGPPLLQLGHFVDFVPDSSGVIKAATATTGVEQYLALLVSQDQVAQKSYKYTASEGSAQPMRRPRGAGGAGAGSEQRGGFDQQLAAILGSGVKTLRPPKPWAASGVPPKLGEQRPFKIEDATGTVQTITAEVIAVDSVAAFWLDKTTTPLATIDPAALKEIADGFTKIIVPRERAYFGKESDIDGDGTISVLFSPIVGSQPGLIAYVSLCDLLDPAVISACSDGNKMELLYVSPLSSLQPPLNTPKAILETVAHEFQHAIYFYRKFVLNNITSKVENPYITEGLSALAQDLSGFQAGNIAVVMTTLPSVDQMSVDNALSETITKYLPKPTDGIMRGLGYLLLRYLFDRAGGDALDTAGAPVDKGGMSWLHALIDSKEVNAPNFTATTQLKLPELILQFWTAMAISNRGPGGTPINSDPKLNFQATTLDPLTGRQRGNNLFGDYHGTPLGGPKTQSFSSADGDILGGGAEFLLISAKSGQPNLTVKIESDPAAKVMLRLIRIK